MDVEGGNAADLTEDRQEVTSLKQDPPVTEENSAPNDKEEGIGKNTVNGEVSERNDLNGSDSSEVTNNIVENEENVAMDTGSTEVVQVGGNVAEFGVEDDDVLDLLETDDVSKNDQTDGDDLGVRGDNLSSDIAVNALQITNVVSGQMFDGMEEDESVKNEQLPVISDVRELVQEEPDKSDDVQDLAAETQLVPRPGENDVQEPAAEQDDDVLDLNEESDQGQTDKDEINVPQVSSENAVESLNEDVDQSSSHVTLDVSLDGSQVSPDDSQETSHVMQDDSQDSSHVTQDDNQGTSLVTPDDNQGTDLVTPDDSQDSSHVTLDDHQGTCQVTPDDSQGTSHVTLDDDQASSDIQLPNPEITNEPERMTEDLEMTEEDNLSGENRDEGMEITDEMEDSLLNKDMDREPEAQGETTLNMEEDSNTGEVTADSVEMGQDNEEQGETTPQNVDISEVASEDVDMVKDEGLANKESDEQAGENDVSMEVLEEKVEAKEEVENKEQNDEAKNEREISNENEAKLSPDIDKDTEVAEVTQEEGVKNEEVQEGEKIETPVIENEENKEAEKSEDTCTIKPDIVISEESTGKSSEISVEESVKSEEKSEEAAALKETEMKTDQKLQETVASVKKAPAKPEDDDIQIIDLDADDSDTEIKQEKTEKVKEEGIGLGIQISSVSGATDIPGAVKKESSSNKTEVNGVKKETKPAVPVKQEVKQEVRSDNKVSPKSKIQTCIVCKKTGKCKYNIVRNGDIKHLCDDDCFKRFRSNPTTFLRTTPPVEENKTVTPVNNQQGHYKTCQVCQIMNVNTSSSKPFLNWQGMDFCGEDCLGKFQSKLNTTCSICSNVIQQAVKGKFCVKFGNNFRQLCSQACYLEFTKRQKLCECCQKDISKSSDAFVAPAGADGSFKDFCSQNCLQKYEEINNRDIEITGVEQSKISGTAPKGTHTCSVCSKVSTMKHQIQLEGKANYLCGDPCFSAFQYANKLTMNTCDNCGIYCYNEGMNPQYIQFEGQQKRFCSFMCVNTFKTTNKKIVSCSWCNCKKSNFDMIERVDANNKYQLFCSLNCLSLYRVNLQATSNQAVMCDQCKRYVPAQYHLTMSDASVRNFCSYNCVMNFQSQFTGSGSQQNNTTQKTGGIQTRSTNRGQQPQPPTQQKPPQPPVKTANSQQNVQRPPAPGRQTNPNMNSIPIISNVVSLAPQGNQQQQVNFKSNQQVPLVINNKNSSIRTTVPPQSTQIQQTVIIQPPQPKVFKNKSCLCKPFVQTKATSCRPHTQTKETQTDKDKEPHGAIVPIPIPFYVPVPVAMYSQPTPTPFPFPIPIPIPCFIPTTKKSTSSILKHIKEIREKIPDDPLEAELLMMAEAVSAVTKDSSGSESEEDTEMAPIEETIVEKIISPSCSASPEPEIPEKSEELGEDMLQMALRMATEMTSEPVMDLEETIEPVPVNAEPPPSPKPKVDDVEDEDDEDDEEYTPVRETRSKGKGTKRSGGGHSRRRSKRQKAPVVVKIANSPTPEESEQVIEPPPDANLYLKYTYGVNAWKHWVVQKNNQLDKVSKQGSGKLKLFKTDMLQCSADELNYSLCLFVKEVRKPNGEEYAADSIYYLCLGIQMFLFENERIDNIFTDIYYEKFTECLNEVLQRYTPKLNAAGQIVCRIEEEHLWECKQLGAHSPHVLLNTLVYFNTKYFQLKTPEDHLKLSFTHIMKHWKKSAPGKGNAQGRSVYLRYYCPTPVRPAAEGNKKKKEELPVYEQAENLDNPLRCPVKLYEFYLSKCPESIKNRSDAFYLVPERSCVPDSPVWYSTQNLQIEAMNKMLHRTMLVREIQESFIHTQPVYA